GGITTLDFGDIYLGVEELIGEAMLRLSPDEYAQVQLHTKYVPDIGILTTHGPENVRAIIDRSRVRLGVDTLGMVQFHWWDYDVPGYVDALRHIHDLREEQKLRLVGVTNFDVLRMQEFADAGLAPAAIQLQYSLLDRRPEKGMTQFCREHGIGMLCYGTVAGGFLSERYLGQPEPQPPYANRSLVKYKLIIDEFGGWELLQQLLRTLHAIAEKHGASVASIASAYVLSRPQVASVIVGARDSSHLEEHRQIASIVLDDRDHKQIAAVLDRAYDLPGDVYDLERNDPQHSGIMHKANNAK
ncbi:aldo/keto reductase, partial [Candidatus Peregrinibacteria bacterium]|nr:aldo/keto reductase [Candidatus Peregrinibacteria bacterium]